MRLLSTSQYGVEGLQSEVFCHGFKCGGNEKLSAVNNFSKKLCRESKRRA
jgi:hypothetical protein